MHAFGFGMRKTDEKTKVQLPAQLVQFSQNFVSHKLDNHLKISEVTNVQNLVKL